MSGDPKLTIAGNNDLSSEMARHAISSALADPVYLWRDIRDPLVARTPVLIVADPSERAGFARAALDAGLQVVSLPIADPLDLEAAVEGGELRWVSLSHGIPVLRQIVTASESGRTGKRYGVYAAHRLPRNFAAELDEAVNDLLVYITSLVDSLVTEVSSTRATAEKNGFDGWFILAQFADGTIATIEASAVLPDAFDPEGERIVEVTGSTAVLRGEPDRQSVVVRGKEGLSRQSWYEAPHGLLLEYALESLEKSQLEQHRSALKLMHGVIAAASSDSSIKLG